MSRRVKLQNVLVDILGSDNVYFQPPSTLLMKYPCIIYTRAQLNTNHAGDKLYRHIPGYSVTYIDPNPESSIPLKIAKLPHSAFDRHYTSENLNHDVFTVYY